MNMKGLRIGLWVAQVLLALAFVGASLMKLTQPYEVLTTSQAWALLFSPETVKLIGVIELLGVVGLILPAVTRILPVLTPLAAAGLVVVMIGAGATHVRIGEPPIPNVILGGLAAFVAWGRFKKAPIAPRTRSLGATA
jgi:putative oxidoreductase